MPEPFRAVSARAPGPRCGRRGILVVGFGLLSTTSAGAEIAPWLDRHVAMLEHLDRFDVVGLGLTLGLTAFAVVTAILLLRTRQRAAQAEWAFRDEIAALRGEVERANALLFSEPQVVVAWSAGDTEPEILGDHVVVAPADAPQRVLAFGTWLSAPEAQAMEAAVEALRSKATPFAKTLTTRTGRPIEAEGRAIGGRAVLRLRDVDGMRQDLALLRARHQKLADDNGSLNSLIASLPTPIWARDREGRLTFVNDAYARAVEAKDAADAVERGLELMERAAREDAARARAKGERYVARCPAVVAGERRSFDVIDCPSETGSAGIGIDVSEAETMRSEIDRLREAHRRLLDQLATGVASFGGEGRLAFYNAAYRALWDLDAGFLDQQPTDSMVLDRLRSARKLPEQQDFKQWKGELHEAYRALEAKEHMWYLPDGRTLRVVTTPNPEGGVTYLFDDVTERLDLARRFDSLIRVQRETLDNLAEAVAVFGSDGRLRLYNPVFARMWQLSREALDQRPHVEAVIEWCKPLYGDVPLWAALRAAITSIDAREPVAQRLERRDGNVVDCATLPLPDGATLVTFQDVTDTVNVERALRERNEALEAADQIKIEFVHHVSYELRSPLTNIIGFAHFLGDPATGPLTVKQHEYLSYITTSTNALLALINNILDLASIDAGAMTLNLGPVDIRKTMEAAVEGVQDRLVKHGITLDLRVQGGIGSFIADERRVRQVLFNLLANAVGFSPAGETVTLAAERRPEGDGEAVVFTVVDHGPGIPPERKDTVFEWFEADPVGSRHRGSGLGLSLVRSFVELHGGRVGIDSAPGRGTTVVCIFPREHTATRNAA